MNPRLSKEFRALRLPWLVGLAAGLAMLDHRAQDYAIAVAFGCAALLAAMSMGNEFQQRTFALLLSQPCPRRDLWREKLLVLGALAGTVASALFLSWGIAGPERYFHGTALPLVLSQWRYQPQDMVMAGVLFLAVVCSAPLWTLVARSIIGGMVFSLAGALLLLGTVHLGVERIVGPRFPDRIPDSVYAMAWLITGLIYSGCCLLAGWRKFARLELRDVALGESAILSTATPRQSRWWNWLRIRPKGRLRNMVRKELRLQKPIFVVAAVFSLCWLTAAGLRWSGVGRDYMDFNGGALWGALVAVYAPLALALAASISLGEERTLGLALWHLTLPVTARRQWLVKLAVSAAVAIGLGLVLPGLLALATLPEARAGLGSIAQDGHASDFLERVLAIGTPLWLFFVLSFWAATLLGNTMRAVLTAVLGIGALAPCGLLSAWLADKLGGLETGLLCDITAWRQLPLGFFHGREPMPWGFIAGGVILSLAALAQSLAQFRLAQVQNAVVVKCAALLLAIAFLAPFWCVDFEVSAGRSYGAPLFGEVSSALHALPHTESEHSRSAGAPITERDLEKVFPLSARTQRWLRGASLYLSSQSVSSSKKPRQIERRGFVRIKFPNGRECWLDYGALPEGR